MAILSTIETDVVGFFGKNTWLKTVGVVLFSALVGIVSHYLGATSPVTVALNGVEEQIATSTVSSTAVVTTSGTTITTQPGAVVSLTTVTPTTK